MKRRAEIPDIVIGRLPVYVLALNRMLQEKKEYTSSHELGERLGISSAQIRKDLSHFGEFGKQGTGYNVQYLHDQIRHILQVDRQWTVAVVGVGDLGRALAHYRGFEPRGFHVMCLFDSDPAKVGERIGENVIQPMDELQTEIRRLGVQLAMIAVPAEAAQAVANEVVLGGVQAILSYAPITLAVPPEIQVQYIDPVAHLQHMTFYLERRR